MATTLLNHGPDEPVKLPLPSSRIVRDDVEALFKRLDDEQGGNRYHTTAAVCGKLKHDPDAVLKALCDLEYRNVVCSRPLPADVAAAHRCYREWSLL